MMIKVTDITTPAGDTEAETLSEKLQEFDGVIGAKINILRNGEDFDLHIEELDFSHQTKFEVIGGRGYEGV
jgi:hypothetical protein